MLNGFYDKFIFTGTLKYTHNNFYLTEIPFLMAPIETLVGIAGVQDTEFQKKIYLEVKKSTSQKLINQFTTNLGMEKEKEIKLIEEFFTGSGWGLIQSIDMQMEAKRAIIVLENSPFVTELKGQSKIPVDTFLRGSLAGIFSKIFSEDIDCVESECAAVSGERCKFILKPKTEFDFANPMVQQQLSHE
jgi:predicted hydrocarbon binding protein